jgi:hypothetical protein
MSPLTGVDLALAHNDMLLDFHSAQQQFLGVMAPHPSL